jgi:hypothetical protein
MINLIKKTFCSHKFEEIDKLNVYGSYFYGIYVKNRIILYKCVKCDKIKRISIR